VDEVLVDVVVRNKTLISRSLVPKTEVHGRESNLRLFVGVQLQYQSLGTSDRFETFKEHGSSLYIDALGLVFICLCFAVLPCALCNLRQNSERGARRSSDLESSRWSQPRFRSYVVSIIAMRHCRAFSTYRLDKRPTLEGVHEVRPNGANQPTNNPSRRGYQPETSSQFMRPITGCDTIRLVCGAAMSTDEPWSPIRLWPRDFRLCYMPPY
jgi:hypothetical protein